MATSRKTAAQFRNENREKTAKMIERGIQLGVLTEKDGKILVMHGLKKKWVDKETLGHQIANDMKMMAWLTRLVNFSEKVSDAAESDSKTGETTTFSTRDIPKVE